MLYTVARTGRGVCVIGAIPQLEFNALINTWSAQYGSDFVAGPDVAQALGYTFVAGPRSDLDEWRRELGIEVEDAPEDAEAPA